MEVEEQYLVTHNKKLSSKTTMARQVVKDNNSAGCGSNACNGRGHRAVDCPSRALTS